MESTPAPHEPGRAARLRAWGRSQQVRGQALAERARSERSHHPTVDTAFQMAERDGDTGGGIIAGALAYRFFIWLLPLALVLVAGLGFASSATSKTPQDAAATLGLAGLVSSSVAAAAEGSNRWYALIVGVPILVYVTRGLLRALIGAHRLVWEEPRSAKLKPTFRATLILLAAFLAYFAVVGLVGWARATSAGLGVGAVLLALLVYAGIWLFISSRLPHRDSPLVALVPGALLVGAGLVVMQALMLYLFVPYILNKSGTYGALGVAAGLLFGLYLISRLMVFSAVVNATLWARGAVLGEIGRGGAQRPAPPPE